LIYFAGSRIDKLCTLFTILISA